MVEFKAADKLLVDQANIDAPDRMFTTIVIALIGLTITLVLICSLLYEVK